MSQQQGGPKVTVHGAGLVTGEAGKPNSFTIFVQGGSIGNLSVAFEGPSKPEINFKDNKDGSVEVSYTPRVPGDYKIHLNYDSKPVKGSPFYLKISGDEENTRKVVNLIKCGGPGLKEGKSGQVNEILVDCKEAGITGGLSVAMEGPAKPEVSFADNKDGTLKVTYKPAKEGAYKFHLKFGDIPVPGSPFAIQVK